MRPILSLAAMAAFCLTLWHALVVVAPGIESRIDAAAEAALAEGFAHPLGVATRGRTVRVSGLADSAAERDAILARLAALPGVSGVDDRIEVLPLRAPYRFAAIRVPGQPLSLSGQMPSATAETSVLDRARSITTGHMLQSALEIAAGIPGPDWLGSVGRGLDALGLLADGEVRIEGRTGRIEGHALSEATRDAVTAAVAGDTSVAWEVSVTLLLPVASPYSFTAETGADGARPRVSGHAPDPATRALLAEAAAALGPDGEVEIILADGMPARDWPRRVTRGLDALAVLDAGRFEIAGPEARLSGTAATPEAAAEATRRAGDGIALELDIATPIPAATLEIAVEAGAARLVAARLPPALDRAGLLRALPELSAADASVEAGGRESAADWQDALAVLAIALPRLATGEVRIEDATLAIRGQLNQGFSAATTRTALRSAAGSGWTVELALDEAPQPAELRVWRDEDSVVLSGILPDGLAPQTALVRLGGADSGGVTSGGAGDPLGWRQAIDALAALMPAYRTMSARIAEGAVTVDGELMPGQRMDELGVWIAGRLGTGWDAALSGVERPARDGAERHDIATGRTERLSFGHWLPVIAVEPSPGGCARATATEIGAGAITFVAGGAEIEAGAMAALDAAAAIALVCTKGAGLVLEIGGHTDAEGQDEANRALSARRAAAVLDALAARGVPADAMVATGHGAEMPVADNATEDGRQRNRRITLDWRVAPRDLPPSMPPAAPPDAPGRTGAGAAAGASEATGQAPETTAIVATAAVETEPDAAAPTVAPLAVAPPAATPTEAASPETASPDIASPDLAPGDGASGPAPAAAPPPIPRPAAVLYAPAPPAPEITQ